LEPAQANSSMRHYLEKPFTKIGLVEWLKVKALRKHKTTKKNPFILFFLFIDMNSQLR
jgi:hypothetical protein